MKINVPLWAQSHWLLKHFYIYSTEDSGGELSPYYYIDVFNGGQFLTKRSCPRYSPDSQCPMRGMSVSPATPVQVNHVKVATNW